jgi:hypothetical protein
MFYKVKLFYDLGMLIGHQLCFSTSGLNYYYSFVYNKRVFFKIRQLYRALLLISNCLFLARAVFKSLFFCFSNLVQFLVVASLTQSFSKNLVENIRLVLSPAPGFISSSFESVKKQVSSSYLKKSSFRRHSAVLETTLIVSFGDACLPRLIKESYKKTCLIFGIVDSNQGRVLSGVDYLIPANDDSCGIAYFISLFFLTSLLKKNC